MNNNDNVEFVYNIERRIREDEEEFIYTIIKPFCETVVEKKLSKAELKLILEKGMQKSIPLAKVKQAREEIIATNDSTLAIIEIMDSLITESEEQHG